MKKTYTASIFNTVQRAVTLVEKSMRDSVEFYTFYSIENGSKKARKRLVRNATFVSNFDSKLYSNQSPEFYLKKQLDFEPFFRVEIKPNILH